MCAAPRSTSEPGAGAATDRPRPTRTDVRPRGRGWPSAPRRRRCPRSGPGSRRARSPGRRTPNRRTHGRELTDQDHLDVVVVGARRRWGACSSASVRIDQADGCRRVRRQAPPQPRAARTRISDSCRQPRRFRRATPPDALGEDARSRRSPRTANDQPGDADRRSDVVGRIAGPRRRRRRRTAGRRQPRQLRDRGDHEGPAAAHQVAADRVVPGRRCRTTCDGSAAIARRP